MFKKIGIFIFVICLIVVSCSQPEMEHTHYYIENGYEAKGEVLYKVFTCSCGGRILEKMANGVVATTENAQSKLDALKSNQVLYLTAGEYGELSIRNARGNSDCYEGDRGAIVNQENLIDQKSYTYIRKLEDVTITGSPDAVLSRISINSSHVNTVGEYDAVREKEISNPSWGYYSEFQIDGLTIEGLHFDASGLEKGGVLMFDFYRNYSYIKNFTVKDCIFKGVSSDFPSTDLAIDFSTDKGVFENLIFDNLTINKFAQAFYVQNPLNMVVKNCDLNDLSFNVIAMQSLDDTFAEGTLVIENNKIGNSLYRNDSEAIIRFYRCGNADVVVSGNKFSKISGENMIQAEVLENVSIHIEGNTIDGKILDSYDSPSISQDTTYKYKFID